MEVEPEKVYQMDFAKIYGLLVNKAVKKGRTQEEVDEVIRWLTGYRQEELLAMQEGAVTYGDFFRKAPSLNQRGSLRCAGRRDQGAAHAGDPLSGQAGG